MAKNIWLAVQTEENGLEYAYGIKVSSSDNLLCKIPKDAKFVNAFDTKKEMERAVSLLREIFHRRGTYMFDGAPNF